MKHDSIDLGALQRTLNVAQQRYYAAHIVRENARTAFITADEIRADREKELDKAREAVLEASRVVTQR